MEMQELYKRKSTVISNELGTKQSLQIKQFQKLKDSNNVNGVMNNKTILEKEFELPMNALRLNLKEVCSMFHQSHLEG